MPIQNYNIYTGKGFAGDLFDSAPRVTQTGIVEDVTLEYGVSVTPGTAERGVTVGHDTGNVFGITMRELNHEAANRPSDGSQVYNQTESASIMREGFILVEVTVRAAVVNEIMNVVDATGAFSGGTAAGGETASLNVRSIEAGQVGDIIKARIDII